MKPRGLPFGRTFCNWQFTQSIKRNLGQAQVIFYAQKSAYEQARRAFWFIHSQDVR